MTGAVVHDIEHREQQKANGGGRPETGSTAAG
jgi:hypothetical protein